MSIRRGAPMILGLTLALGSRAAWPDTMPEEELYGFEIGVSVTIGGLAKFPEHTFFLFPLRCSRALVGLRDDGGLGLELEDLKVVDDVDHLANFAVLQDGPITDWVGDHGPCQASSVYAMDRELAATIDLSAKTLAEQQAFFADDPRLFRTQFKFVDKPPYANNGSPMRSVHEELRALRIDQDALTIVLDEVTYRFADGTEQTVKLAHTRRPSELPFRPLKPEKIAKYAATFAKWEAKHTGDPPPAPKLPDGAVERFAELEAERLAEAAGTGGTDTGAVVEAPVVAAVEAPVVDPGVAPVVVPAVVVPAPVVPAPVVPAPVVAKPEERIEEEVLDEVEEDDDEVERRRSRWCDGCGRWGSREWRGRGRDRAAAAAFGGVRRQRSDHARDSPSSRWRQRWAMRMATEIHTTPIAIDAPASNSG